MSINHNLLKRKESRSGSNRGPSAYQPSALPLGHTGSHNLVKCSAAASAYLASGRVVSTLASVNIHTPYPQPPPPDTPLLYASVPARTCMIDVYATFFSFGEPPFQYACLFVVAVRVLSRSNHMIHSRLEQLHAKSRQPRNLSPSGSYSTLPTWTKNTELQKWLPFLRNRSRDLFGALRRFVSSSIPAFLRRQV